MCGGENRGDLGDQGGSTVVSASCGVVVGRVVVIVGLGVVVIVVVVSLRSNGRRLPEGSWQTGRRA